MSEAIRTGAVRLEWDAADRLATLRFEGPDAVATGEDAAACLAALDRWAAKEPVLLLVDCAGLKDTEPGWRSAYAAYFRERGGRIAWYNMSPLIGMMVRMFLLATGATGRGFRDGAEARAWLLEGSA